MLKNFEGARLGIFVFLGTVLLVLAIFLIGDKKSLFVKSYHVKTYFSDVQGLKTGASVRLSGINVGSVEKIQLLADTTYKVEVTLSIDKDLKKFIRLDSRASIETEGLIGSKIVSITPGSPNMSEVADGGIIKSKQPLSMTAIIEETQSIMAYMKGITKDFSEIVAKVNTGKGTIGKIINDDKLYYSSVRIMNSADTTLKSLTSQLDKVSDIVIKMGAGTYNILANVDTTTAEVKKLIDKIKKGEGVLGALISDRSAYDSIKTVINNLSKTTIAAKEGTEAFLENMEALKHNWLFKGYFEERGYWNEPEYEIKLEKKIKKLKEEEAKLQEKIKELKELNDQVDKLKNNVNNN